jgi:hypothetical protein
MSVDSASVSLQQIDEACLEFKRASVPLFLLFRYTPVPIVARRLALAAVDLLQRAKSSAFATGVSSHSGQ